MSNRPTYTLEDFQRDQRISSYVINSDFEGNREKLYKAVFRDRTIQVHITDLIFLHTLWTSQLTANPPTFFSMVSDYAIDGRMVHIPVSSQIIHDSKIPKSHGPYTTLILNILKENEPLPVHLQDLHKMVNEVQEMSLEMLIILCSEFDYFRIVKDYVSIWY